jgi:hypothetical protein
LYAASDSLWRLSAISTLPSMKPGFAVAGVGEAGTLEVHGRLLVVEVLRRGSSP